MPKEISIPRSHVNAFLAHGPGTGQWWAEQFNELGVTRNDRVRFVLDGVVNHLRSLDALVLHTETPRGIADVDRLGVPQEFIGWHVIFYDGQFPAQDPWPPEAGRRPVGGDVVIPGLAEHQAKCHPKLPDNSPAAQRAVTEMLRGIPAGARPCADANPCPRCVSLVAARQPAFRRQEDDVLSITD